jgi:ubiquinone/menaquinone biosynthesis C-methylase UbiE
VVRAESLTGQIAAVLDGLELEADGIYSSALPGATGQADEIRARQAFALLEYPDPLLEVGRHHSIPVMDREVRLFLGEIAAHGVVADIGGGWGWHWRHLKVDRPDVYVVVVDFVRANLRVAAGVLGALVNDRVFLVHGDATMLPFPSSAFDGYWSIQTLQHISCFEQALKEAYRILRPNGQFASYSLNRAKVVEAAYKLMGKSYHVHGKRPGNFHLTRGGAEQASVVADIFGSRVTSRYTEIMFHPDFRLSTGATASWVGRADAYLSSSLPLFAWVARQRSYHARKRS